MKNLPVKVNILQSSDNQIRQRKQIIGSPFIQQVSEVDINEMFSAADSNQDGNIRYSKHILNSVQKKSLMLIAVGQNSKP